MIFFEDLIHLFNSNEASRGIVRLNIAEGALLYKYCRRKRNGILLEIGRKHGGSTSIMSAALEENGKLYSIDIIEHDQVKNNISKNLDKVKLINGDSKKIHWDIPVDLIFVDGDHSYKGVKSDIEKYSPYLNKDGYLIMHDVIGKKSELQPIISKLLNHGYAQVDKADSMLVLQKKGGYNSA